MQYLDCLARVLLPMLLIAAWTDGGAAEFAAPTADGWHTWQVPGNSDGARHCCFRWHHGSASRAACDLDDRQGSAATNGDCDLDGEWLSVYARVKDGNIDRIRAFSSSCAVTSQSPLGRLGSVDDSDSIAWLVAQVGESRVSEDAIAAIAQHNGRQAFVALTGLLEDRNRSAKTREQALFWLAQIDSDEVFTYLDALLSRN